MILGKPMVCRQCPEGVILPEKGGMEKDQNQKDCGFNCGDKFHFN